MVTLLYSGYYDYDNDVNPFMVDSNFYYITSCDLPNLTILQKGNKRYLLIDLPQAFFYDTDTVKLKLKYALKGEVVSTSELGKLLQGVKDVNTLPNIIHHPQKDILQRCHLHTTELTESVTKQREIKYIDEISAVTTACKYTSEGIEHIMKLSRLGMNQRELIGIFKYYLSQHGIQELSFNPIASHGKDNSILHYEAQNKRIKHNSLVLVDLGCRYKHYCSDITRTFPISGKFSKKGKTLYNIVLTTLKYALKEMKPNSEWKTITNNVRLKLFKECHKAGIFKDVFEPIQQIQATMVLMPHDLGHHVGLDNHDCGPIKTLQKDMVIAVEPGIYFNASMKQNPYTYSKAWNQYAGLGGVRIEDTIVITSKGHKNLSKVTKDISGIEKLMK